MWRLHAARRLAYLGLRNEFDQCVAAVANIADASLAAKAASVANIPTFIWLDSVSKVPDLGTYLADASALQKSSGQKQLVQIVLGR